jgi:iron complex outermembrane receptor protein
MKPLYFQNTIRNRRPARGLNQTLISDHGVAIRGFLLILVACCSLAACARSLQVKGSVIGGLITDQSGKPLPGATVMIEKTYRGVTSDFEGKYIFTNLEDGVYKLRFSFVGFKSRTVEVKLSGSLVLNMNLEEELLTTGEVIVSATRAGQRSPLAYSSLDNGMINRRNAGQDIPFILSLTPSLVETSEAGNGIGYTNLRIRGTDASRINVTIDGIPLNDPESQQVFWVDLPDLALSVDNIQVQRGVGTSSNGSGAFGATVSIQTLLPASEPFTRVGTSIGSFNTFRKSVETGTGILADRFAFNLRLSEIESDGFIDRTGSDHRSAFLSGVYLFGKSRLRTNIILGEEHTGIGWWGVPSDTLPYNRRFNPAGEYTDEHGNTRYYANESDNYNQNHYQLIYSLKMNDRLNMSAALHYTRGKGYYEEYREDESYADYGIDTMMFDNDPVDATDIIRRKWMDNHFTGGLLSLVYRKGKVDISMGLSANHYAGDHFGKLVWMRYAGNLENDYRWYLNRGEKGEVSFFSKLEYTISGKISVFGDIQYRHINYRMSGIDDDLKNLGQRHEFNFFNPKAGVFVSITPDQDIYLSFSVANREPARSDFKEAAGDPDAMPHPETLYDLETGYRIRGRKYSSAINLYGMFYRDQLIPTGELSDVGYPVMTNVRNSHRLGFEMISGIQPTPFLEWDINMTLSSNRIIGFTEHFTDYNTHDWSETRGSKLLGNVDIAYSPSFIGGSDLGFIIPGNIAIHFISKRVGKQYFDNTMNPGRSIGPYFVNNARIDFQPVIRRLKKAELQLYVNNIFNSLYESNAYGGNWYEDGVEKTWAYYFPQAGINFMVRALVTF